MASVCVCVCSSCVTVGRRKKGVKQCAKGARKPVFPNTCAFVLTMAQNEQNSFCKFTRLRCVNPRVLGENGGYNLPLKMIEMKGKWNRWWGELCIIAVCMSVCQPVWSVYEVFFLYGQEVVFQFFMQKFAYFCQSFLIIAASMILIRFDLFAKMHLTFLVVKLKGLCDWCDQIFFTTRRSSKSKEYWKNIYTHLQVVFIDYANLTKAGLN